MSDIFEEAEKIVKGDRREDYGDMVESHEEVARIWSVILGTEVTAREVVLCMIGTKLRRESNKPKKDNRVDIAGYDYILDVVTKEEGEDMDRECITGDWDS